MFHRLCRLLSVLQQEGVQDSALVSTDGKPLPLTPILAIGSNAGPEQLARKFPLDLFPAGVVVPVSVDWLGATLDLGCQHKSNLAVASSRSIGASVTHQPPEMQSTASQYSAVPQVT